MSVSFRRRSKQGGPQRPPLAFLKQLLPFQSIQQMADKPTDTAPLIFQQLRHLFFQPDLEENQIAALIRNQPIVLVDKMLYGLTQLYNQKIEELIQPLEEQRNNLTVKLAQIQQKLTHVLDDNQHLKYILDKMEDQKKQLDVKLNQSQEEISRSKEEALVQFSEKEKVREQLYKVYGGYEAACAQNSHFKQAAEGSQKQLEMFKQMINHLQTHNKELKISNQQLISRLESVSIQLKQKCHQNQQLTQKVTEKDQFIASFIDEYNRYHLFNQRELTETKVFTTQQSNGQLQQYNFDFHERDKSMSQSSSKHSLVQLQSQIDINFGKVQEELNKQSRWKNSASQDRNLNSVNSKHNNSINSKQNAGANLKPINSANLKHINSVNSKQINSINSKNLPPRQKDKNSQQKTQQIKIASANKITKILTKTQSSKHLLSAQTSLRQKQDSKELIHQIFKKKIAQKNCKIQKLQQEVNELRDHILQQRQAVTMMQGEYQLKLDQIKEELQYTKKEMTNLHLKYSLSNAQLKMLQENNIQLQTDVNQLNECIQQLQHQIKQQQKQHQVYCQQLQKRCKIYLQDRISTIQKQALKTIQSAKQTPKTVSPFKLKLNQCHSCQSIQADQDDLQPHEQQQEEQDQEAQLDLQSYQESEAHSFKKINRNRIYGLELDLQFSSKMSQSKGNQQIYIQQNFQIDSDLGQFTERFIIDKKQQSATKRWGNHTARARHSMICFPSARKSPFAISRKVNQCVEPTLIIQSLCFVSNLISYSIQSKSVQKFTIKKNIQLTLYPKYPKLEINQQVSESYQPALKKLQIFSEFSIKQSWIKLREERQTQHIVQKYQCQTQTQSTNHLSLSCFESCSIIFSKNSTTNQTATEVNKKQFQITQTLKIQPYDPAPSLVKISSFHLVKDDSKDIFQQTHIYIAEQKRKVQQIVSNTIIMQNQMENSQPYVQIQKVQNFSDYIQNPILPSQAQNLQSSYNMFQEAPKEILCESRYLIPSNDQQRLPLSIDNNKTAQKIDLDFISPDNTSFLDKAMIITQQQLTQLTEGLAPNPQSKCNKKINNQQEVGITPWLVQQPLSFRLDPLPQSLKRCLSVKATARLQQYLDKLNYTLKYQRVVEKQFRKPNQIKRKLFIFVGYKQGVNSRLMLSGKFLVDLQSGESIRLQGNKCVDKTNFMFGQSQVFVTNQGSLVVHRAGKRNCLGGQLADGNWEISAYWQFQVLKNNK